MKYLFMFPAMGDSYQGMGQDLYQNIPTYRAAVDQCAQLLAPLLEIDIRDVLYPPTSAADTTEPAIRRTLYAYPALFTTQYALSRLLAQQGILPAAVLGYSIGEITAACICGVFSLADALFLTAHRSRLIESVDRGNMLLVHLPREQLEPFLDEKISLAVACSPQINMVAGSPQAITQLETRLRENRIMFRANESRYPLHCPLMESINRPLSQIATRVKINPPQIPLLSNISGTPFTPDEICDHAYWGRHVVQTVQLEKALKHLLHYEHDAVLEVGPGQTMCQFALENAAHINLPKPKVVPLMRPEADCRMTDRQYLDRSLERLQSSDEKHSVQVDTGKAMQETADELETPEALLTRMWCRLLDRTDASPTDNFFYYGGHSLQAMQFISQIDKRLGVRIPFHDFFKKPTLESLIRLLHRELERKQSSQIQVQARDALPGPFPLTYAQERLWFLDRLEPDNPAYNVPIVLKLEGDVEPRLLERCLNELADHQPVLKTVFNHLDETPSQIVRSDLYISLAEFDISLTEVEERSRKRRELLLLETHRLFQLTQGPMMRAALIKTAPRESTLLLVIHHIHCDGWSINIFIEQLAELYSAHKTKRIPQLETPPALYFDFAVQQRGEHQREQQNKQLGYWESRLAGADTLLDLPYFVPRPPMQTYSGRCFLFAIPPALTGQLKQLSRQQGKTVFTTLAAAFNVLLHRYSGNNDICIGTPSAGRDVRGVEKVIGFFVNTLVLRTRFSSGQSFLQLLEQVSRTISEAYAHQDVPFERLTTHLAPQRDLSRNPLFQVLLVQHIDTMVYLELPGLSMQREEFDAQLARFDLTLGFRENELNLNGLLEYNVHLFQADIIEAMVGHFLHLLTGIVAHPEMEIDRIPLLTETQQLHVVKLLNQTDQPLPDVRSLIQWFKQQADKSPDSTALQADSLNNAALLNGATLTDSGETNRDDIEEQLSFKELERRVAHLTVQLRHKGVGPGAVAAVMLDRSAEMVISLLAVLQTGAAYLPIDPGYPRARIQYMLADSNACLLISQPSPATGLQWPLLTPVPPPTTYSTNRAMENCFQSSLKNNGNAAAYIIYTSGSSGKPKGVLINQRSVINFLHFMKQLTGISPSDTWAAVTTISFDISVLEIFLPLISGARLLVLPDSVSIDGQVLSRRLDKHQATIMQATPITWRLLAESGRKFVPPFKILCGGETLSPDLADKLKGTSLINLYGPTETTIWSCFQPVLDNSVPVPIGTPIANTGVYVLDAFNQPVPVGVPGQLFIAGLGLARGYVNKPEETVEKFITTSLPGSEAIRLYKTGDLVRRMPDGILQFLGRMDAQVKVRGFRIDPGEIEATLNRHDHVRNCAVIAHHYDLDGDVRLSAYVILKDIKKTKNEASVIASLQPFLEKSLPAYMVPVMFVRVATLPLTENGKLDRKALPKPDAVNTPSVYIPPRDQLERDLVDIWQRVLKVKAVSMRDNFFRLGGYSLLSLRLFYLLKKELALDLPVAVIFTAPTIEKLAQVIRSRQLKVKESHLVPIHTEGTGPPIFLMHHMDGGVIDYQELVRSLDGAHPIYGLQAPTADGGALPRHHIHRLAEIYAAEITAFLPQGPYVVGGHSFGGWLAFETACTLQKMGKATAMLVLIDTRSPDCAFLPVQKRIGFTVRSYVEKFRFHARRLWAIPLKQKRRYFMMKIVVLTSRINKQGNRLLRTFLKGLGLIKRKVPDSIQMGDGAARRPVYVPGTFTGNAVLFKSAIPLPVEEKESYGWRNLIEGKLEIFDVPGEHGNITKRPNVDVLAKKLLLVLEGSTGDCNGDSPGGSS